MCVSSVVTPTVPDSCAAPAGGEKRKRTLENGASKPAAAKKARPDGESTPKREAKPAKKKPKQEVSCARPHASLLCSNTVLKSPYYAGVGMLNIRKVRLCCHYSCTLQPPLRRWCVLATCSCLQSCHRLR